MFSSDSDMLKSLPKLSRQELEVACEDFSNIIGSSPETVVYKGTMKCRGAANHSRVAEGTRPSPEGVYSGVS